MNGEAMSEESTRNAPASVAPIAPATPPVDGSRGNSLGFRTETTDLQGGDRTHEGVLSLIADVERMLDTLKEEARQDLGRAGEAERLAGEVAALTGEVAALRAEIDALEGALAGARDAHRSERAADAEARAEIERSLATRDESIASLEGALSELGRSLAEREEATGRLESHWKDRLAESEDARAAADAACADANAAREAADAARVAAQESLVAAEELFQLSDEGRRAAEAAAEALAARLEESESDRAALRARLAALEAELAGLANTLADAIASRDAQLARLADERNALLEAQCRAQSSLAAAHAEVDRLRGRVADLESARSDAELARAEAARAHAEAVESARIERDRMESFRAEVARREADPTPAMTEEHAGLVLALGEAEARLAAAVSRLEATDARLAESDASLAELRLHAAEVERERHDANAAFEAAQTELDAARVELDAVRTELAATRGELASRDERLAELSEESVARAADRSRHSASFGANEPSGPDAGEISEEEIARVVEARIQQILQPRLAQLAQVAQFLKTRKERLAALHRGLKRRARAQRALRQVYGQGVGEDGGPATDGSTPTVSSAFATTSTTAPAIAGDTTALETERRELEELRVILAASEQALARRAAGTRLVTTTALASAFLAVSAALSWHVAGVIAPTPALASIDLVVASRAPESQQDATPDAGGVAAWLESQLADERFTGVVAGRLGDLGRTNAESATLVDALAERMTVASDGPHVRLSLRGESADAASAALDAVATAAVSEANRLPERRSDLLRVAIANAGQEVGRAVFAKAAALPDPSRLARAGTIFGACVGAAALVAGLLLLAGRRTARLVASQA
ncbi:MAG: hypothetical protein RI967_1950 [Planctomycetota bacterium]